jgi:hypothetical protein
VLLLLTEVVAEVHQQLCGQTQVGEVEVGVGVEVEVEVEVEMKVLVRASDKRHKGDWIVG